MGESIQFIGRSRFLDASFRKTLRKVLVYFADKQGFRIDSLVYVHQNDDELLQINLSHLEHDTYTDIITFDLSDLEEVIDGEVYISVDRVQENARLFETTFEEEYVRVVSHGLFHLLGYGDKSEAEAQLMREKENEAIAYYLSIRST